MSDRRDSAAMNGDGSGVGPVDGARAPHVAVVGGGIAGLSAAWTLVGHGARVTLLEADHLGGKLRTVDFAGRPVEEGPDAFLTRVPDATRLAREVGIGDQLVAPATGRAFVLVDGNLVALPTAQVLGVPADPDAADLATILDPASIARLRADCDDPGPPPAPDDDPTIGAFIRSRLGDAVAERLVGPLVGGINAGDVDALSLAAVTPQLDRLARSVDEPSLVRAAARMRAAATTSGPVFSAPAGGMAALVDATVAAVVRAGGEIRDDVAVRSIERLERSWRVIADQPRRTGVATEVIFEADGIVLATPASVTGSLVQDHAPTAGMHLGSIPHASVAIATFAFDPAAVRRAADGSGFLVPRSEGTLTTAASWLSTKWERLAPGHGDGTFLIRVSAGRADDRRIAELDDATLLDRLAGELVTIIGGTDGPVARRLRRWPSALPQYTPGHLDRIAAIEADLAAVTPPVAVAGCALRGVGIPASIASGRVAADRVFSSLSPGPGRGESGSR